LGFETRGIFLFITYKHQHIYASSCKMNDDGVTIPHTYRVEIVEEGIFGPDILERLPHHIIVFTDHSTPPHSPVARPHRHGPQPHSGIPLPNPEFFALHRSIAHVLHMSGAGEAIDLTFKRFQDKGHAFPLRKIRDADTLAASLAALDMATSLASLGSGNATQSLGD
jgi:hypothetical protein